MTELRAGRRYDNWAKYRSSWWTKYFQDDIAFFWPPQLDMSEVDEENYRSVSRNDVFDIASTDSEHRELHTAVAAYVWGVGFNSRYAIGRLVRAFTANAEQVESNLRTARSVLVNEGAVAAYSSMLRGGAAKTKFMGPAYFSKYLFFIGYQSDAVTGLRPLILDKRVATALRARGVFDPRTRDGYWTSELYREYLSYCHNRNRGDPESIEVELFNEGGSAASG